MEAMSTVAAAMRAAATTAGMTVAINARATDNGAVRTATSRVDSRARAVTTAAVETAAVGSRATTANATIAGGSNPRAMTPAVHPRVARNIAAGSAIHAVTRRPREKAGSIGAR